MNELHSQRSLEPMDEKLGLLKKMFWLSGAIVIAELTSNSNTYIGEFKVMFKNTSVVQGKTFNFKNQGWKISWDYPFKPHATKK